MTRRPIPWRSLAAKALDKATLLTALLTWWFVLRPDAAVTNLVDAVSHLATVYSAWRSVRSLAFRLRPAPSETVPESTETGENHGIQDPKPAGTSVG